MARERQGDPVSNQVLECLLSLFGVRGRHAVVQALGVTPEQYRGCLKVSSGVILRDEERFTRRQGTPTTYRNLYFRDDLV